MTTNKPVKKVEESLDTVDSFKVFEIISSVHGVVTVQINRSMSTQQLQNLITSALSIDGVS